MSKLISRDLPARMTFNAASCLVHVLCLVECSRFLLIHVDPFFFIAELSLVSRVLRSLDARSGIYCFFEGRDFRRSCNAKRMLSGQTCVRIPAGVKGKDAGDRRKDARLSMWLCMDRQRGVWMAREDTDVNVREYE